MSQEKRFGKRIAEPSSVQIVHELKLMALRQSLDAALAREAAETGSGRGDALASAGAPFRADAS